MGGVNCDNSNGRTMGSFAASGEAQEFGRVDSQSYHLSLLHFCKSLFAAQRRFLEFNECIEDLLIFEEAGTDHLSLANKSLYAALTSYHQQLFVTIHSRRVLSKVERSRFDNLKIDHKVAASEVGAGYMALSKSEEVKKAEEQGLIPSSSTSMEANISALGEHGDCGLVDLHGNDLDALLSLCERFQKLGETLEVGGKSIALMIREVDSPLMPFCLRSMTLWVNIMTRQAQWAYYNTVAFRSVNGIEISTEQLLKAI